MNIEYAQKNINLFKEFLKPVTIKDTENYDKYFLRYKDNIKAFLEKECNINITIYFHKKDYHKTFFYLIETDYEVYTSDEDVKWGFLNYNEALNSAITFIFTNILNVVKV